MRKVFVFLLVFSFFWVSEGQAKTYLFPDYHTSLSSTNEASLPDLMKKFPWLREFPGDLWHPTCLYEINEGTYDVDKLPACLPSGTQEGTEPDEWRDEFFTYTGKGFYVFDSVAEAYHETALLDRNIAGYTLVVSLYTSYEFSRGHKAVFISFPEKGKIKIKKISSDGMIHEIKQDKAYYSNDIYFDKVFFGEWFDLMLPSVTVFDVPVMLETESIPMGRTNVEEDIVTGRKRDVDFILFDYKEYEFSTSKCFGNIVIDYPEKKKGKEKGMFVFALSEREKLIGAYAETCIPKAYFLKAIKRFCPQDQQGGGLDDFSKKALFEHFKACSKGVKREDWAELD